MPLETIREVLARRDGMDQESITELLDEAREAIADGEDPGEVVEEFFGLEPDYIFDAELIAF